MSASPVRQRWPDSLFGRLALLLVAVAIASHVLALSLMFELRPGGPPPEPPPARALAPGMTGSPLVRPGPPHGPPVSGMLLDIGVRLGAVLIAAWVGARWLSAPLRRLAGGTQALAADIRRAPLPLEGPAECREAGAVINRLQQSILAQMDERDRFVAAVSHDLRTPLTRLALRVESLDDAGERERFGRDIRAMETMIRATLGYLQGDAAEEEWTVLELGSLLSSVAEDRQDCGQPVTWPASASDARPLRVKARVSALRRALDNLVDNALFYGGTAELGLLVDGDRVRVSVADHGPGIPEHALEQVLQPFVRLDASRNRHTGGTGLGLAVVADTARRHGGRVELGNRPGGGLLAQLVLPLVDRAARQTA